MTIRRLAPALALAMGFLAAAVSLKYAQANGFLGDDGVQRAVQVMIGLMLAGFANVTPKRIGAQRLSLAAEARMQTARRAGGWSLTLAGLTHAALWAFAPPPIAMFGAMTVVGAGLIIAVGYALWACRKITA